MLALAVWFGLLTGLGELGLLAGTKFVLHRFIFLSRYVVWMAPLMDLVFFVSVGLALALAARRWPRLGSLPVVTAVFAFLSFLSLLFMYAPLHTAAAALLAAGLATQSARLAGAHPDGLHRLQRRTTLRMVALVVALGAGVHGWEALRKRTAVARALSLTSGAPNVLLIVLDTVRAMNLSVAGYKRPTTPQFERLARAGVYFERAVAPAPWTLPSHASMFTGRLPHELSADWRTPLDAARPTLAEIFGARGFATAGFVGNTNYASYESGLDRGFVHYEDYRVSPGQIVLSASLGRSMARVKWLSWTAANYAIGRVTAAQVNEAFLSWLDHKDRRPFFVFLNYFDAHSPYSPPPPYDRAFGPKRPRSNVHLEHGEHWTSDQIQAELDAYDGGIAYLDQQLGRLFGQLETRGVLENTLVIITSDHGEEFGEHGIMSHGNSLYWPSLHVPLLIAFRGRVAPGGRVGDPVSLRDLPATIADLVRLEDGNRFPGRSLARFWGGARGGDRPRAAPVVSELSALPQGTPSWFPISRGAMKSLVVDGFHYIRNGDGREELYDVSADPLEQHDLSRSAEGAGRLAPFRAALDSLLAGHQLEAD